MRGMLGFRIHADRRMPLPRARRIDLRQAAPGSRRRSALRTGRHAAHCRAAAAAMRSRARRVLQFRQREVLGEPAGDLRCRRCSCAAAPRGELRVRGHIGGAADLVLVPRHQHAIARRHQIRLDVVGALQDGQRIGRPACARAGSRSRHDGRSGCGVLARRPSAHGHQFFRRRGMNRHRVVEVALGRAHAHGHRESLQHLVHAAAGQVQPTMRSSGPTVTSFMRVLGLASVSAWYIGTKVDV